MQSRGVEKQADILLIDKPKGMSSFDVIRVLRKKLGIRKMGHAGTLDPLATGLLIIGVGDGTKKLSDYIGLPKTYEVEALFGKRTTTGDLEGDALEEARVDEIDVQRLDSILSEMHGALMLPVPLYSAIKKEGKPLYKYARAGKAVDVPIKSMQVFYMRREGIECLHGACVARLVMDVGSGTYVRSVVEEIGKRMELPATVKELRRTRVGNFLIQDAEKI